MTFLTSWEDFEMAAERLYLQDPMKVTSVRPCQFLLVTFLVLDPLGHEVLIWCKQFQW